jgi:hypothetical protein
MYYPHLPPHSSHTCPCCGFWERIIRKNGLDPDELWKKVRDAEKREREEAEARDFQANTFPK